MPALVDHTGKRFGRLLVIKRGEGKLYSGKMRVTWFCQCDCGTFADVSASSLAHGTKSCGCLHLEAAYKVGKNKYLGKGVATLNTLISSYRQSAKKRSMLFTLTKSEFSNLIQKNCFYCGDCPKSKHKGKNEDFIEYNGLDRIDNKGNYSLDNVVTCCVTCNYAKAKSTQSDFSNMIKKIYERHLK